VAAAICPGCGLEQRSSSAAPEARFNASSECWALFGELSAYTLTHGDPKFIHQHAVDAWQAQHVVGSKSNIGLAFSLIGLCLALERGFTGRQVQLAHMELGRTKRQWPWFDPPVDRTWLTVVDVLRADPGVNRDGVLMQWAAAVWTSWSHTHDWTRQICAEYLKAGCESETALKGAEKHRGRNH
jgi:Family of unknown function (DUF5946)